ncbi:MAG: SpoIIE family protein phosphatase [Acidobacteria bacterium]|nr:SpoIIE family protein phosphatase [Acidobacteriota bacterium]
MEPLTPSPWLTRLRRKRWIHALLAGLAALLAGLVIEWLAGGPTLPGSILQVLGIVLMLLILLSRLFLALRWLIRKMFFKVRNRIIANYFLTGLLPLFLLALLVFITGNLFLVQLASYHLKQLMADEFSTAEQAAFELSVVAATGDPDAGLAAEVITHYRTLLPGLQATVPEEPVTAKPGWTSDDPLPWLALPAKTLQTYIVTGDIIHLVVQLTPENSRARRPVQVSVPLAAPLLTRLEKDMDGFILFIHGEGDMTSTDTSADQESPPSARYGSGLRISIDSSAEDENRLTAWLAGLPDGLAYLDSYTIALGFSLKPDSEIEEMMVLGIVRTKYSAILGKYIQGSLPADVPAHKLFLWLGFIVGGFFAFIELIAFAISLVFSRSITKVIGQLHRKTRLLAQGDFDYRIDSKRRDQLGELARSFDGMSDDLQHLLIEVKEKERMERELAIAQELQNTFFPKSLPDIQGVNLWGKCLPARKVSGDYYDFIQHADGSVDFYIGDISGKGISAALLMASTQTFLRLESAKHPRLPVHKIVANYNNYLLNYSAHGKFSTLFFGRLDKARNTLSYCNAGHNPPFLFRQGQVLLLETGGMITGIFEDTPYESETVLLQPKDLLLAYTDGFTEVFNQEQEEFGADRLCDLVCAAGEFQLHQLYDNLVSAVRQWSAVSEQADDMTMLMVMIQ